MVLLRAQQIMSMPFPEQAEAGHVHAQAADQICAIQKHVAILVLTHSVVHLLSSSADTDLQSLRNETTTQSDSTSVHILRRAQIMISCGNMWPISSRCDFACSRPRARSSLVKLLSCGCKPSQIVTQRPTCEIHEPITRQRGRLYF